MKALVTGSNGFIGSHLVEALLQAGFEVACYVRSKSDHGHLKNAPVQRAVVDYSKPETLLNSNVLDGVDFVFHNAGVTKRVTKEQFYRGNVEPTQNLLEAIKAKELNLKRFVFISSQAALGPSKSRADLKTEDAHPAPIEFYGESKFIAEQVVQEYGATIPYTIIRPSSVYGPRDVDFLNIFRQIKRGFNIYVGNRNKFVSMIYVDDLVNGILHAAHSEAANRQIYHLCGEAPFTWEEIQGRIVKAMHKKVVTVNIPEIFLKLAGVFGDLFSKMTGRFTLINSQKINLSLPDYWLVSNQKAKQDFGFACRVSLDDGLRQTLEWYRQKGWV
ncbi:MAG: NAD-dependent epimerase/dehydratase family protein [bacterium]